MWLNNNGTFTNIKGINWLFPALEILLVLYLSLYLVAAYISSYISDYLA